MYQIDTQSVVTSNNSFPTIENINTILNSQNQKDIIAMVTSQFENYEKNQQFLKQENFNLQSDVRSLENKCDILEAKKEELINNVHDLRYLVEQIHEENQIRLKHQKKMNKELKKRIEELEQQIQNSQTQVGTSSCTLSTGSVGSCSGSCCGLLLSSQGGSENIDYPKGGN